MPKRKITPELWAQILDAYNGWDPSRPGAPTVDELLAPFGISKQAFYAERRRQGLPNRADWRTTPTEPSNISGQVEVLLEALVECRLRVRELEARNRELEARLT